MSQIESINDDNWIAKTLDKKSRAEVKNMMFKHIIENKNSIETLMSQVKEYFDSRNIEVISITQESDGINPELELCSIAVAVKGSLYYIKVTKKSLQQYKVEHQLN